VGHASPWMTQIAVQYFILLVDRVNIVSDAECVCVCVATAVALCLKRTENVSRTKQLWRFRVTIVTMYMCACV